MCGRCDEGWRFETVILSGPDAGQVTGVLHPISAEWEDLYSRPSTGSVTLAARDVAQANIWPDTGIYISQIMSDGSRRARFGGFLDKNNGSGGGALNIGMHSIDRFLDYRLLAGPESPYALETFEEPAPGPPISVLVKKPIGVDLFLDVYGLTGPATKSIIPVTLVKFAQGNFFGGDSGGILILDAVEGEPSTIQPSAPFNENDYKWWDVKNIGQLVTEIVEAVDGPKYELSHTYSNGYWSSLMTFADTIGTDRDYTLKSDREGWQYGLEVDGSLRASRVYGIGAGEEWNTTFSVAYDAGRDTDFPERQVTVAWKDQTTAANLDAQTKGHVVNHRDPTTIPSMTVVGMPDYDPDAPGYDPQKGFPAPEICRPGDTFNVDIGYGAVTVKDIRVRNLGVSWVLGEGAPVERTLAMQPVERPALSVKTQTPAKPPKNDLPLPQTDPTKGGGGAVTADPWPTPGLVTRATNSALAEISGMEASLANPNHVWVHNDEQQNPQVHLVYLGDGHTAATFTPNPGVSGAPVGDPEAIRLARSTRKLVLADIGDNDRNRPTSGSNQPHLLALPEPKGAGNKGKLPATRYPIAYPNGERVNAECLLIHPTTEQVFIVSKEPTRARVFSYGPLSSMSTTNNVGTLVKTLAMSNVSDGCHTWAGDFILFRRAGVTATNVLRASDWRYMGSIETPAMAKSEAICVRSSCAFLTTTEGARPPIYQVLIPKAFGATCATPSGPSGGGGTSNPNATVPGQLINMSNWKLQLPI